MAIKKISEEDFQRIRSLHDRAFLHALAGAFDTRLDREAAKQSFVAEIDSLIKAESRPEARAAFRSLASKSRTVLERSFFQAAVEVCFSDILAIAHSPLRTQMRAEKAALSRMIEAHDNAGRLVSELQEAVVLAIDRLREESRSRQEAQAIEDALNSLSAKIREAWPWFDVGPQ